MINYFWFTLIGISAIVGVLTGRIDQLNQAIMNGAKDAVEISIGLIGIMGLWLGIMRIAEHSGLINLLSRALYPVLKPLFKELPEDNMAMGAMIMNLSANTLGLGNAATPMGIKAMEELQRLNPDKESASDAMCMFLVLNTECVQFMPTTMIAIRAVEGSKDPAAIVLPIMISSITAAAMSVIVTLLIRMAYRRYKV
ncbi:nucleoside recognition domain-containing protein [Calorimonas adulescens]|jgi:Nucleoside recognition.|uniref:Nucleoside recognition protein n=1 Tax=Calorimonas adulescens TaxID=2606906 RepID=A0A5D8QC72_9THEO|nr:nucleoside recognition domain-containing protein [Calorimonas adulescens]TZE82132.1 nucleoside recognition protein [Calorimonas adulescens]